MLFDQKPEHNTNEIEIKEINEINEITWAAMDEHLGHVVLLSLGGRFGVGCADHGGVFAVHCIVVHVLDGAVRREGGLLQGRLGGGQRARGVAAAVRGVGRGVGLGVAVEQCLRRLTLQRPCRVLLLRLPAAAAV